VADTTKGTTTYVPPGEGESLWMAGEELATIKVRSEDTGGAYSSPRKGKGRPGRTG